MQALCIPRLRNRSSAGLLRLRHAINGATNNLLSVISVRDWNRKAHRMTKKGKKRKIEEGDKYLNSIHSDSNYFKKPNVVIQKIPFAMTMYNTTDNENGSNDQNNQNQNEKPLKLDDEYWLEWTAVEAQLDFNKLVDDYKSVIETHAAPINFSNALEKSKYLSWVCRTLRVEMRSSDLRSIRSQQNVIEWLVANERKQIMRKWHRQRLMKHNLPDNLIIEVPWFYCSASQSNSAWKRDHATKG